MRRSWVQFPLRAPRTICWLERVLTNERADLPAITQRRALAQEARPAAAPTRPRFEPRCEIPTWVSGLKAAIGDELGRAHDTNRRYDNRRDELAAELRKAERHRDHTERILDRHRPARAAADREVSEAQQRVWSTNAELRHSKGLKRRGLRHQVGEAREDLAAARQRQQVVEEATLPDTKLFRDADLEVRKLMMQLRDVESERRTALGADGTDGLTRVRDALFHWRCWAEGRPVPPDVIVDTVEELRDQRMIKSAYAKTLLKPLEVWCESHGIQSQRPVIQPAPVERAPDLGIGL
jgi:hypothetical protein